jgi:hypothetical protein
LTAMLSETWLAKTEKPLDQFRPLLAVCCDLDPPLRDGLRRPTSAMLRSKWSIGEQQRPVRLSNTYRAPAKQVLPQHLVT